MGIKVLYHDKCFDGFTAAWAAWKHFGDTAEYVPVSYGQPPYGDTTDQDDVYLLDFCYPVETLRGMSARKLVILDHHKTAQADLENFKPKPEDVIIFDMERSGAGIAWDYFFPEQSDWATDPAWGRPKLVDYAEDHDLWRYRLPESRSIRAYMHSLPYDFIEWDDLNYELANDFYECVGRGKSIQGFMKQQVKMIADNAVMRRLIGRGPLVPVVNATTLFSEVGEELNLRFPNADYSAYYFDTAEGDRKWGLRTKQPGVDVSTIAQMFGGGGHKGAAGFTTDLEFLGD